MSFVAAKKMIVREEESGMIRPSEETPKQVLWTSNIDQLFRAYMTSVYFYKPNSSDCFFNADVLKEALRKVLVPFYPVAGRLKRTDEDGRMEIVCNGEGVLFVEAYTDSYLDDLGDFAPTQELSKLIPKVDDSLDISSHPIAFLQVTYFKCGGVSLGVAVHHTVVDGASGTHFVNSWSQIARGLDIKFPPFIYRTLLHARVPPTPTFPHIEHHPPPSMKFSRKTPKPQTSLSNTAIATFKITCEHINILKEKCRKESNGITFSSYKVLAGHVWRCVSKARNLQDDQELYMSIAVDGRRRLHPPLPLGYLGNAIFHMTPKATSGELLSNQLAYAVEKINKTLDCADDEYFRSALDYLELEQDLSVLARGPHSFRCPNLGFTSWSRMSIHDADFGWGRPIYMGPGAILYEGLIYVIPSPVNDGSLSLAVSLDSDHMELFKEYLYSM